MKYLPTQEPDYSNYLTYLSRILGAASLFAGFLFTVITLLLTQLPYPDTIQSQGILLFFNTLFLFSVYLVGYGSYLMTYFCKKVPPMTPTIRASYYLSLLFFSLSASAPTWLFFLWNLTYLTLASFIIWIIFTVTILNYIYRPLRNYKESRARILRLPVPKTKNTWKLSFDNIHSVSLSKILPFSSRLNVYPTSFLGGLMVIG